MDLLKPKEMEHVYYDYLVWAQTELWTRRQYQSHIIAIPGLHLGIQNVVRGMEFGIIGFTWNRAIAN